MRRILAAIAIGALSFGAGHALAQPSVPVTTDPAQRLREQIAKERDQNKVELRRAFARGRQSIVVRTDVQYILRVVAVSRGLNPDSFRKRAGCETGWTFNPRVVNSTSGVVGLFQFEPSTFRNFTKVGAAGFDPKDALANALGASEMLAAGLQHHWDCNASGIPKSNGGAPT